MEKTLREKIIRICLTLIDQKKAKVIVPSAKQSPGFWFGGGNMVERNGIFYVVGRYRNHGDSRVGVIAGERGAELAIFSSKNPLGPFEKNKSFMKSDLSFNGIDVISIEGSSLYLSDKGVELFISTEKKLSYPTGLQDYQKPGTGVWTIDCINADSIENLNSTGIKTVISEIRPEYLHVKDPVAYKSSVGDTIMLYATHPFTWTSSNTSAALRAKGKTDFISAADIVLNRGNVWDIAVTRITDCLTIKGDQIQEDFESINLFFYDGAECLRPHQENEKAVKRPRGYSCEELAGLAYSFDDAFPMDIKRISINSPFFISPYGTGCCRYISTLVTDHKIIATWQQSQQDGSQGLVANEVSFEEIRNII